jgi:5,6,7,8-tetrahydromethanopterin hydro-lyase
VWVNPAANDEEAVFANNRDATLSALAMARSSAPDMDAAIAAMLQPENPYFRQG